MSHVQHTDAIVLKAYHVRETSLLITFYTREFGKVKALVKGVRKKKSPLLSHFEPFTYVRMVLYHYPKREIDIVSDSSIKESFPFIRNNFNHICHASYIVDLVDAFTQVNQPDTNIFDTLLYVLFEFKHVASATLLRYFEIRLLDLVGMFPIISRCVICGQKQPFIRPGFSIEHGGIVCMKRACQLQAPDMFDVSLATLQSMMFLQRCICDEYNRLHIANHIEKEMERVLQMFIMGQLQYEMKTMRFLREIQSTYTLMPAATGQGSSV